MVDEAVSTILDGLAKVLGARCCSMILPSGSQIREGREFSLVTNGVSGVSVVLRVGLLYKVREMGGAGGDRQVVTLLSLMEELRKDGTWCWFYK